MRHSYVRRRYHPGRRGTPRLLRCEPLEHRWLLSITVDTLVDEADGSIDDGDISLRDAIAAAATGETIDFAASLDGGTIQLELGALEIRTSLSIDGPGPGDLTIDAQGNSRVFDVDDGAADNLLDVVISGLTLTGGHSDSGGGIVSLENLTVSKVSITGNSVSDRHSAAGIDIREGDLLVMDSSISGNLVGRGIFLYHERGREGNLTVTESTISGNTGGGIYSGGIYSGHAEEVVITRSTISDNIGYNGGGGIYNIGGNLTISDSVISGNSTTAQPMFPSPSGGGIYHGVGNLTLLNSRVTGNTSQRSGGGIDSGGGRTTIIGSTISDNAVNGENAEGGGLSVGGNDMKIVDTTISGNSVHAYYGRGGGIVCDGGEIINTTISGNELSGGWTGHGGGIYKSGGNLTIRDSTISGNHVDVVERAFGGGIDNSGGNLTLSGSTVYGNSIAGKGASKGGGILNDGDTLQVNGSIVARNAFAGYYASDLTGAVIVTHSLVGVNSHTDLDEAPIGMPDVNGNLIGDVTGSGAIDPLLGPLADNGGPTETHALLPGSPAIDAGDPGFAPPPESDQRGVQRIADGDADGIPRIDMGAYELLRGDLNDDGKVNGLDVDPFLDALTSSLVTGTADMNADGSVNGLDVDPFVAAVVGGGNSVGVASLSLLGSDGQPGIPFDVTSASPTTERSSARLLRTRHVHDGDDHSQLIHRRAVERVTGRRLRLGRDGHRSDHGDMAHQMARDWRATVDRAFGDGDDWIR